jgi:hypothetical protein
MNHYPFEEWLFEEHLSLEEQKQLKDHLAECVDCRELRTAINETDQLFSNLSMAEPVQGFTSRWVEYADQKELVRQKGTMWKLLFALVVCAGLSILILQLPVLLSGISFTQMFTGLFLRLVDSVENFYSFFQSYKFVLDVIPFRIPAIVWAAIGMNVMFWITVWSFSLWKVVGPKRSIQ